MSLSRYRTLRLAFTNDGPVPWSLIRSSVRSDRHSKIAACRCVSSRIITLSELSVKEGDGPQGAKSVTPFATGDRTRQRTDQVLTIGADHKERRMGLRHDPTNRRRTRGQCYMCGWLAAAFSDPVAQVPDHVGATRAPAICGRQPAHHSDTFPQGAV